MPRYLLKLVTEKELRDLNWYSLKDYHAETTDALAKDVDSLTAEISKTVFKLKKMQRWRGVLNIWSLMQRRSDSKSGKILMIFLVLDFEFGVWCLDFDFGFDFDFCFDFDFGFWFWISSGGGGGLVVVVVDQWWV